MTAKKKNKGGRPSKYKPEYCAQLVEHMGDGYSFESFSAIARVSTSTLYEWRENHSEFSEALKEGVGRLMHAWETTLIGLANGAIEGSTTAAIFALKNHFRNIWRDSHEVEHKGLKPFVITDIEGNPELALGDKKSEPS